MELKPGEKLGPYVIVSNIGRGGMGEVWKARDSRLNRVVAIKTSLFGFSGRFQTEAQTIAALNHPNICTLHDIGPDYLVMEYIEGATLAERIKQGPVPLAETLGIARQIADALEAAHEKNIVHRDLKPANILLTKQGIKLLDFGLAKQQALGLPNDETLLSFTITGQISGTLQYMSPEQLQGKEADARSDIFSFGCVLYEMLSGGQAFKGSSVASVIAAVLEREPDWQKTTPPLDRVIRKCLAKDPNERFQTARDLKFNLGLGIENTAIAPPGKRRSRKPVIAAAGLFAVIAAAALLWFFRPAGSIDSMAVLPFQNATGDTSLDYISEGLGEAISDDLSRIPTLRVIARSVIQRYRGSRQDAQAIGRELNVHAVLSGRVARQGDSLKVRVELLNVANGAQLWARDYQSPEKDLAKLQETLSENVAFGLRQTVGDPLKQSLAHRYATNSEAYQLYLKGRFLLLQRRTLEDAQEAVRLFGQAVEKDPFFALAHAGLADAYILIAQRGYQPPITVLERAKSAAKRALELDNSLSEGWVSLALAHTLSGYDWQAAEQEYRHAIELNPRNTQAHTSYALTLLCPNQRPEEALLEIQRALDLEPGSVAVNMIQGMILLFARRYDQAIAKFQAVGKMAPELPFAPLHLAVAYLDAGKKANAVAIAEEPGLKAKLPLESHIFLGAIYAGTGRLKDAQEIATELEEQSRRAYVSPYGRALIQASLGKSASALSLLEEAYAVRDTDFIFLKVDPQLDSLRSLGGFQKLLKKANF